MKHTKVSNSPQIQANFISFGKCPISNKDKQSALHWQLKENFYKVIHGKQDLVPFKIPPPQPLYAMKVAPEPKKRKKDKRTKITSTSIISHGCFTRSFFFFCFFFLFSLPRLKFRGFTRDFWIRWWWLDTIRSVHIQRMRSLYAINLFWDSILYPWSERWSCRHFPSL